MYSNNLTLKCHDKKMQNLTLKKKVYVSVNIGVETCNFNNYIHIMKVNATFN